MSLYRLLRGKPPMERIEMFYKWAGIENLKFPRWRDVYVSKHKPQVKVFTRSGGGNREEYEGAIKKCCDHPGFIKESDDSFDSTYMTFVYKIKDEFLDEWEAYVTPDDGRQPIEDETS